MCAFLSAHFLFFSLFLSVSDDFLYIETVGPTMTPSLFVFTFFLSSKHNSRNGEFCRFFNIEIQCFCLVFTSFKPNLFNNVHKLSKKILAVANAYGKIDYQTTLYLDCLQIVEILDEIRLESDKMLDTLKNAIALCRPFIVNFYVSSVFDNQVRTATNLIREFELMFNNFSDLCTSFIEIYWICPKQEIVIEQQKSMATKFDVSIKEFQLILQKIERFHQSIKTN